MDQGSNYPLDGLKVIDLADEKGVFCSKLLADLGADVIKVEKPGGDSTRNIAPFQADDPNPEKSLYFAYNNTNKRSITLNLETAEGRELFRKLVKSTDIIVETYPPGYLADLGLGYSDLCQIRPELIITSLTAFGQTGPHKDFKSSDIVSYAMGGLMYQTGDPDMPPLLAGGLQTYYISSLYAVVATQIALYARDIQGRGQQVDVSIQECIASMLEITCRYLYDGFITRRIGAQHHGALPTNNYPCKDGYWNLCVGPHSAVWIRLVAWMIRDGLDVDELANQEYEDGENRRPILETKIHPIIREWCKLYTKAEIFYNGQKNDVSVAPVNTVKEVVEDPHLNAREFFEEVSHPVIGKAIYPGIPWRLPNRRKMRPAPLIGQHNQEIYRELGLINEDLIRLREAGVI